MRYPASKTGVDLENWVKGRSKSLKLVPFERLDAVSYIYLANEWCYLVAPQNANRNFLFTFYMVLSCVVCELLVENRDIFISHLYLAPPKGVTLSEFREAV